MSRIKVVNLTPHDVVAYTQSNKRIIIPASGDIARIEPNPTLVRKIFGVPLLRKYFEDVYVYRRHSEDIALPEQEEGVYYIVSNMVAQRSRELNRNDLIAPDTGTSCVRDGENKIIGVRNFQIYT